MADASPVPLSGTPLATYGFLPRLGGAGIRFELHADALEWDMDMRKGRLLLRDVEQVHLLFQHAKFGSSCFEMRLVARDGTRLVASSVSRVALTRMEDQRVQYTAFVRAFHRAVAASGAQVEWTGGYKRWRWNFMVGLGLVTLVALLVVLVMSMDNGKWMFIAMLTVFAAVLAWPMMEALWRNQPVIYGPEHLPHRLLPG